MKLNEMICPTCGHRFFVDASYGTCDACHTFFYAQRRENPTAAANCSPPLSLPDNTAAAPSKSQLTITYPTVIQV